MKDNIYVYRVPFPATVREAVLPCADGYTVYINEALDMVQSRKAYEHALRHISRNDFRTEKSVQQIEEECHADS